MLELKTRNYTLEDQFKKQRSALGDATARVNVLQQELNKATRTIEKSKKLTEVQKILTENESLQRKLMSQEDEFRLQNQTLLNELTVVSIQPYSTFHPLHLLMLFCSLLQQMKN